MRRPAPPSSALGRLLEAAGYRIESRGAAICAVRGRDRRAVVIVASTRSPAEVEGLFPSDAVQRTIVYDDDPGETARGLAADRGIEILDPSTLGSALGEILLPSPASTPSADPAEPAGSASALDAPFALTIPGERTVRPRIGREEAETIAGIDGPRYLLRLVPFYVAAYRVRAVAPYGGERSVQRRLIAVNAVTRRAEVWEEGERELVEHVDEPHQCLAPQLSDMQAAPIALDAIRQYHTVHVEHSEQHGGALVIETRRLPPSSDDVRLGPFVLLFVPHWYAEGREGRVVLDAVTGRRVVGPEAGN
jgi:hypothetical protein